MILGFLDWNSWVLPHWVRLPVGGLLIATGISFAFWGLRTLGSHASLGLGGELVSSGPYRYSRNPEYVGDIVALLGYAIVCNSLLVLVVAALGKDRDEQRGGGVLLLVKTTIKSERRKS